MILSKIIVNREEFGLPYSEVNAEFIMNLAKKDVKNHVVLAGTVNRNVHRILENPSAEINLFENLNFSVIPRDHHVNRACGRTSH